MKVLSIILALFTFALTVLPCNWDDMLADDNLLVCNEKHEPVNSHSSCPDGHCCCSPFSNCTGCSGIVFEEPLAVKKAPGFDYTRALATFLYANQYVFNLFASIWQPPKIQA